MRLNPFTNKEKLNISSLNEGRNMLFFCFMLVAPFYIVTGAAFIVDLMGVGPEITLMTLGMGMAAWGSLTSVHWSNLKNQLAELKLFSAIVRFNQTVAYQLDMLFDEDRIEYVGSIKSEEDGIKKEQDIYKVQFLADYGYEHPSEGLITFNKAFIVLPYKNMPWKETFTFKNKTQVWYRGLALTSGNSEFVVFDVAPVWDWIEGEWIPTFKVADCWQRGVRSNVNMLKLKAGAINVPGIESDTTITVKENDESNPFTLNEILETTMIAARKEITNVKLSKAQITASRDNLLDAQRDFGKELTKRYDADKQVDKYYFADDIQPRWRNLNWKYFFYGVATLGILAVLLWLLG